MHFSNGTRLENIGISNGVANIGNEAFEDCYSLSNVLIPSSVTNIGSYAFESTGLTNLSILGAAQIGAYAFSGLPLITAFIGGSNW